MMRWRRNEMQPVKKDMLEGDHLLGIESQDASKQHDSFFLKAGFGIAPER